MSRQEKEKSRLEGVAPGFRLDRREEFGEELVGVVVRQYIGTGDRMQVAVDAKLRWHAHGQQQVGAAGVPQLLQQHVDAATTSKTFMTVPPLDELEHCREEPLGVSPPRQCD